MPYTRWSLTASLQPSSAPSIDAAVSCISLTFMLFSYSLFWALCLLVVFGSLLLFSLYLRVPAASCSCLPFGVWGGLLNLFSSVLLPFGCVPYLTALIGGQFSWSLCQETIGLR